MLKLIALATAFVGIPAAIGAFITQTWWHGALAGGIVGLAVFAAVMWWVFEDFRM